MLSAQSEIVLPKVLSSKYNCVTFILLIECCCARQNETAKIGLRFD